MCLDYEKSRVVPQLKDDKIFDAYSTIFGEEFSVMNEFYESSIFE